MPKLMKMLIIGGNSFVGSSLTQAFVGKYQVVNTFRRNFTPIKGAQYVPLPLLTEREHCSRFIKSIEPEIVIYCLGNHDIAEAEKDPKLAQELHSGGIPHIMHAAEIIKARFIYISADYVFSGVDGNFGENDVSIPYSSLGKAKLGAENLVKTRSLNHLIVRCAPLLGRGTLDHPSWLDDIREKIIHNKKVSVPSKIIHNPVHISFLADVIHKSIEMDIKNRILHVGGLTKVSMYDLARKFVDSIDLPVKEVEMSDAESVANAIDYSLNLTETLQLIKTQALLLEQSFDLFK